MFTNKRVERCPVTQTNAATVYLDPTLREPLLVALYGWRQEFMALLKGTRNGRVVHVTGIEIPEQFNSGAACELVDNASVDWDNYLGFLHSHVDMGAFHSCTDAKGVDQAPMSLVISRTQDGITGDVPIAITGKVAVELPCGSTGVLGAVSEHGGQPLRFIWGVPGDLADDPAEQAWVIPTSGVTLRQVIETDCDYVPEPTCGVEGLSRDFSVYNAIVNNTKQRQQYTNISIDRSKQHWEKDRGWVDNTTTSVTDTRRFVSAVGGDSSNGAGKKAEGGGSITGGGAAVEQPAWWEKCDDCGAYDDQEDMKWNGHAWVCQPCFEETEELPEPGAAKEYAGCSRCGTELYLEESLKTTRCFRCREEETLAPLGGYS